MSAASAAAQQAAAIVLQFSPSSLFSSVLALAAAAATASSPPDACDPLLVLRQHQHWVYDVAVCELGILTGSEDRTARLFSRRGRAVAVMRHPSAVVAVAFLLPSMRRAATGSKDGGLRVWNLVDGTLLAAFLGVHVGPVRSLALSRDGRVLISGGFDAIVRCWRVAEPLLAPLTPSTNLDAGVDPEPVPQLLTLTQSVGNIHTRRVMTVCINDAQTHLVSCGYDCTAQVVELSTGQVAMTFAAHTRPIRAACFIPDSDENLMRVCTAGKDAVAKVWDSRTGRELLSLSHPDSVLAVTAARRVLITACVDNQIRLFDVDSGRLFKSFVAHSHGWTNKLLLRNGRLFSASDDGTAKAFDVYTKEMERVRALCHAMRASASSPLYWLPVEAFKMVRVFSVPPPLAS